MAAPSPLLNQFPRRPFIHPPPYSPLAPAQSFFLDYISALRAHGVETTVLDLTCAHHTPDQLDPAMAALQAVGASVEVHCIEVKDAEMAREWWALVAPEGVLHGGVQHNEVGAPRSLSSPLGFAGLGALVWKPRLLCGANALLRRCLQFGGICLGRLLTLWLRPTSCGLAGQP